MFKRLVILITFCCSLLFMQTLLAADPGNKIQGFINPFIDSESTLLKPDVAFRFNATKAANKALLHWDITPGYYLYKNQIKLEISPGTELYLEDALPKARQLNADGLGELYVYADSLDLEINLDTTNLPTTWELTYQGCSENGFCYSPVSKKIKIRQNSLTIVNQDNTTEKIDVAKPVIVNETDKLVAMLREQSGIITLGIFFGLGLLLTFTPCVLPMIPIVVNMIVGHGHHITAGRAFFLSTSYVLSMSICYAIAGILAGTLGSSVQAVFQQPIFLVPLSLLLVVFSLSQFNLIHLPLPQFLVKTIHRVEQRQLHVHGTLWGTMVMGLLSALMISPCVTPALIGALTFIAQDGSPLMGGGALFVLGLGMGMPLILVATTSGGLLPKTGPWMNEIKCLTGFMLLALAIWILDRILPTKIITLLWVIALIIFAVFLGAFDRRMSSNWKKFKKAIGLTIALYASVLMVGIFTGGSGSLLFPLQHLTSTKQTPAQELSFSSVNSIKELELELQRAVNEGKPTMLEFYADWCVACKRMHQEVYTDPEVMELLETYHLIMVDVTEQTDDNNRLALAFGVFGPPTSLFFDAKGHEESGFRMVGEYSKENFVYHLRNIQPPE